MLIDRENTKDIFMFWDTAWEQQATSLFSLLTLHCWAGHLNANNMSVMAPFYHDGWPHTFSQLQEMSAPQFSDLFNLETWHNVTKREYRTELIPWSHGLREQSGTNEVNHCSNNILVGEIEM